MPLLTRSALRPLRTPLLGASVALLLTSCVGDQREPEYQDPLSLGQVSIQLTRAENCDDLLTAIQEGAVAQLNERVQRFREAGEEGYYGYDEDSGSFTTVSEGSAGVGQLAPSVQNAGAGGAGGSSASGATPPPDTPFVSEAPRADSGNSNNDSTELSTGEEGLDPNGGFSGTTVQVVDVDEADIVKTDGDRMYVLHGGTLLALNAWPADATSIIASAQIEGEPVEMFVYEGKAVVFSRVYQNLAALSEGASDNESRYYYDYSGYTKITVLDVSGDNDSPGVVRESYIEGNYSSARRHDGIVRAVVEDGYKVPSLGSPNVEFRDPFGEPYAQADIDGQLNAWAERMTRAIRATDLGDWIPREFEVSDGSLDTVAPRCGDYYRPDTGLTQSGVTSVVALDMDDVEGALGGATILGRAERVYANQDALIITQTDYRYQFDDSQSPEQTILHRFDIDGAATGYTASGSIAGRIHNQFSLDERDGIIRVSTTEERWQRFASDGDIGIETIGSTGTGGAAMSTSIAVEGPEPRPAMGGAGGAGDQADEEPPVDAIEDSPPEIDDAEGAASLDEPIAAGGPFVPVDAPPNGPINRVVTLEVDGNDLVQFGSTVEFGATERIYATRFMGDRAYVVTFRRTDPLFVLDMSDDADPKVVGELHIPGFSDYLFPVSNNHLFAIGRDADDDGRVRGLALQLFDVTDATRPLLVDRYVYGDSSFSPGNVDHRAISFHQDGTKVAFPFQDYRNNTQTLEVFGISTETGLTRLGGVDNQEDLSFADCLRSLGYNDNTIASIEADAELYPEIEQEYSWQCNYYGREFKRAIFRDDVLFGVSSAGLYSYDLAALDAGVMSSLAFPAEIYNYDNDNEEDVFPTITAPPRSAPPTMVLVMDTDPAVDDSSAGEAEATDEETTDGDEVTGEMANNE